MYVYSYFVAIAHIYTVHTHTYINVRAQIHMQTQTHRIIPYNPLHSYLSWRKQIIPRSETNTYPTRRLEMPHW